MPIVKSLKTIGRRSINAVWRIGYATRFFGMTLFYSGLSFRRFQLTVKEMFSSGVMSLIIILVAGLFVGIVLGMQGYETLKRYGSESRRPLGALQPRLVCVQRRPRPRRPEARGQVLRRGNARIHPGGRVQLLREPLQDLGTGANNLLQGKFLDGASDLARFAVNSVVGIGGLWDVVTLMGLEKHEEDFGQTLGWWGVPPGPYFVIPVFGPSTLRDAPARWVDPSYAYNRQISDMALRNSLVGLDIVRSRAGLLKAEKILDEAALDRYSFTRDAWLQRRRHHVYDGRPPRDPEDE